MTQLGQSMALMMCLRNLQRYWNPICPSDHTPYRAVASILNDGDKSAYLEPLLSRQDALETARNDLGNQTSGMMTAAHYTLAAIICLIKGDDDGARTQNSLADHAMQGL